ncbi:MAG: hypothetical protein NTZ85_00310 [Bacteroidia bacterium]|nr:hypothetical protein [Bacteroidia bacterium]
MTPSLKQFSTLPPTPSLKAKGGSEAIVYQLITPLPLELTILFIHLILQFIKKYFINRRRFLIHPALRDSFGMTDYFLMQGVRSEGLLEFKASGFKNNKKS